MSHTESPPYSVSFGDIFAPVFFVLVWMWAFTLDVSDAPILHADAAPVAEASP